ncbi:MAG: hypothetical protein OEV94_10200 [Deltaproteobacteria bacterium]|nr:hypothetical protein [Deltaproteobacteria bacterium]MDH4122063.1 hypothetical protein [Deltaproteobacteria bacterium]
MTPFRSMLFNRIFPLAALAGLILSGCSAGFVAKSNYIDKTVKAFVYKMPAKDLQPKVKDLMHARLYLVEQQDGFVTLGKQKSLEEDSADPTHQKPAEFKERAMCQVFEVDKNSSRVECYQWTIPLEKKGRSLFLEYQLVKMVDPKAYDKIEADGDQAAKDAEAKK